MHVDVLRGEVTLRVIYQGFCFGTHFEKLNNLSNVV